MYVHPPRPGREINDTVVDVFVTISTSVISVT